MEKDAAQLNGPQPLEPKARRQLSRQLDEAADAHPLEDDRGSDAYRPHNDQHDGRQYKQQHSAYTDRQYYEHRDTDCQHNNNQYNYNYGYDNSRNRDDYKSYTPRRYNNQQERQHTPRHHSAYVNSAMMATTMMNVQTRITTTPKRPVVTMIRIDLTARIDMLNTIINEQ